MKQKITAQHQRGVILIYIIIIVAVFSVLMLPLLDIVSRKMQTLRASVEREQSLQIAEAGINYYQWRLAHFQTDYQDGTGQEGPYVHDYVDFDTQQNIGKFSLMFTPPLTGSTIVTIQSTGWTNANPGVTRTIIAKYGIPSIAKYAFLSNDVIWIGPSENVTGEFHSNNGIRFDGTGNAPIQSTRLTYTCSSSQGSPCPAIKNGIWGSASQAVKNFWSFPVPGIDFSSLTADFSNMKGLAQTGGIYLPPSNAQGYSLVFKSDGTIDIFKVTSLTSHQKGWDTNGAVHNEFTVYNARTLLFNKPMPANGVMYLEDKTWVEGTVNGVATVVAALLPLNTSTAPTIYIAKNIVYQAKHGSHSLGLIAQKDVVISYTAPSNLEINAAMIAQNCGAQFFYYPNNIKNNITVFGSIMTFAQWTWTWVNSSGTVLSGYRNTFNNYDSNLLYGPPPSF